MPETGRLLPWAEFGPLGKQAVTGRLLPWAEFGPLGEQASNGPEVIEGRKGAQEHMGRQ